jgi:hypothetical protein
MMKLRNGIRKSDKLFTYSNLHQTNQYVATLALGSRPRQRACKGVSQKEAQESRQRHRKGAGQEEARELRQEEARESHHILPGVLESVRECEGVNIHTPKVTPTLGDGVPVDFQNFRK